MKNFLILFFFSVGAILILIKILRVPESNEALIDKFETVIDIGSIAQNSDLQAESDFVLRNISQNDLIISQIIPDCSCTTFEIRKDTIPVNDSVVITLRYDKNVPGYFSHYVHIHCNTPNSPIMLTILGKVIHESSLRKE